MRTAKTTAIAFTAVAALLGTAGAATAVASAGDDSSPSTAEAAKSAKAPASAQQKHEPKKDGARRLCRRAPHIEKRINRALKRLDAGAGRRGSLARLEKRAELAKKAGHTEVATFLNNRLDDRRARESRLKDRKKDVAKLHAWCKSHHNGRTKAGSDS